MIIFKFIIIFLSLFFLLLFFNMKFSSAIKLLVFKESEDSNTTKLTMIVMFLASIFTSLWFSLYF